MSTFKLSTRIAEKNIQRNLYDIQDKINELQKSIENISISELPAHTHPRSEIIDFWSSPFWDNIPDKPATYPPSEHTHTRSEITDFWSSPFWNNIPDKPSTFPPSSHTHTRTEITNFWSSPFWNSIPDKPSTYPPSAHTHSRSETTDFWATPFWSNIPDKPSTYPPSTHTHAKSDITGLPWSWSEISKSGSSLSEIETRPHSALQNIGAFDHHGDFGHYGKIPKTQPTAGNERVYVDSANLYVHDGTSWVLRATKDWNNLINKPSTFPPSSHTHTRSGITDFWATPFWANIPDKPTSFTPSAHASSHHSGGSDQLSFSSIAGFSNYLDQAVKQASSPTFATIKLTNLSDGYIPYHVSDTSGLANSELFWDATNARLGIGTTTPCHKLCVNGYIHATSGGFVFPDGSVQTTAASGGQAYPARAYLPSDQAISSGWTKVNLTAENFDPNGRFDTTNRRYIAPVAGYYLVSWGFQHYGFVMFAIFKNGSQWNWAGGDQEGRRIRGSDIIYLNANDYIEFYAYTDWSGGAGIYGGTYNTYMAIAKIG